MKDKQPEKDVVFDEARKQLLVAVGMLSATPQFQDQHPEEVLTFVEESAQ